MAHDAARVSFQKVHQTHENWEASQDFSRFSDVILVVVFVLAPFNSFVLLIVLVLEPVHLFVAPFNLVGFSHSWDPRLHYPLTYFLSTKRRCLVIANIKTAFGQINVSCKWIFLVP